MGTSLGGVAILAIGGLMGFALLSPDNQAAPAAAPVAAAKVGDIPANYLTLYKGNGQTCAGIDWALLAAIGKIESNHGQSTLPGVHSGSNKAGAQGPMQFLPATYKSVRGRHPEIGRNVYDPANAIPAAAHLLCDNGASKDLRRAVWHYNHSQAYVNKVLAQADRYRA